MSSSFVPVCAVCKGTRAPDGWASVTVSLPLHHIGLTLPASTYAVCSLPCFRDVMKLLQVAVERAIARMPSADKPADKKDLP